jgi:cytochrome oxidase Cu insertion factor (SCO1/SenC/PrrC family)
MKTKRFVLILAIALALAVAFVAISWPPSQAATALKIGDQAPDFALPDQNGRIVRLADYRGKKTAVLAFYIKASTPG